MQTIESNVLSELKSLSDSADHIINECNNDDVHVDSWFKKIKETVNAIVKGTDSKLSNVEGSSTKSSCSVDNLPNLVTLIKGNEKNVREHKVSDLLAEVKKDHVRRSKRKSRKSLRKLILEKRSGNSWKISNPEVSIEETEKDSTPKRDIKDNFLETQFKTKLQAFSINKSLNKKYFPQLSSELNGVQNEVNSDTQNNTENFDIGYATPVRHSKVNSAAAIQILKTKKNEVLALQCDSFNTPISRKRQSRQSLKISDSLKEIKSEKNKGNVIKCSNLNKNEDILEKQTFIINPDCSGESVKEFETPVRRSKRKSSVQFLQENVKRIKKDSTNLLSKVSDKPLKNKRDWNLGGNEASKRTRKARNVPDAVIPGKTSNDLIKNKQSSIEKRTLREIQKKEEIVTQNAKKIKSLREQKMEESKKARELKMEKALQLRMKIEKEKEERLRSHTRSTQENSQHKESSAKKIITKTVLQQDVKNNHFKIVDGINSDKNQLSTAAKSVKAPVCESKTKELPVSDKEIFVKPNLNATYVNSPGLKANISTSTPAKKMESKLAQQSYSMTPSESSFVSYDVSEIKSDDSDEEECNNKPIPSWASGIRLKNALINQHYNPINIDEEFGNYFEIPKLEVMMGVKKKHYNKRTSSAVWTKSPNRSILL